MRRIWGGVVVGIVLAAAPVRAQDGSKYTVKGTPAPAPKAETMEAKELHELSNKAPGGSHPGVLLLFPNEKPEDTPKLADKGNGHWALMVEAEAVAGGQKTSLGLGITLVGQSSAN